MRRVTTRAVVTTFPDRGILGPFGIVTRPDGPLWPTSDGGNSQGSLSGPALGRGICRRRSSPIDGRVSLLIETHDLTSLSGAALDRRLAGAESEERVVSERRRRLCSRLDWMKSLRTDGPEFSAGLVSELQEKERALSDRCLELRQQITELRTERKRRLT